MSICFLVRVRVLIYEKWIKRTLGSFLDRDTCYVKRSMQGCKGDVRCFILHIQGKRKYS